MPYKAVCLIGSRSKDVSGKLDDLLKDGHPETMLLVKSRAERNVLVDSLKQNGWRIARFYRDLLLATKNGSNNLYVGMDGNRPEGERK